MEKQQEYWGKLPATYFFLAAMSAMMFVLSAAGDWLGNPVAAQVNGWVSLLSGVLAGLGSLLLLAELTHKSRGHLVNAKPFSSVMSFGSLVQSVYLVLVFAYASFFFPIAPWATWGLGRGLAGLLAVVAALLYVTYPGVELGESKGRSFWNGGGLVGLFLVSGTATGAALLTLVLMVMGHGETAYAGWIRWVEAAALAVQLFTVIGYVLGMKMSAAEEARRGAEKLWSGDCRQSFWVGIVLLGTLVPLVFSAAFASVYWQAMAAVLVLAGAVIFRIDFLRAGVRAVLPGEERGEMSPKEIAALAASLEKRWEEKSRWLNP